jgi:hypothetical protein
MAERLEVPVRPRAVRTTILGVLASGALLLSGCGDEVPVLGSGHGQSASPSTARSACSTADADAVEVARADLDGDGATDAVRYAAGSADCPAGLVAEVDGQALRAPLQGDLPVTDGASVAVQVPGRTGELVLVVQSHPRGGFQARLFGYAGDTFTELRDDGHPVFPFVATDVTGTPLTASCTRDGFTITEAVAHQPVGVMPAWDVVRTTYAVDGNTVRKDGTEEVADNVLDRQLQDRYADLVSHSLFPDCRVGH